MKLRVVCRARRGWCHQHLKPNRKRFKLWKVFKIHSFLFFLHFESFLKITADFLMWWQYDDSSSLSNHWAGLNPVSCLSGAVHGKPDASAAICDTVEGKQEVDPQWWPQSDVSSLEMTPGLYCLCLCEQTPPQIRPFSQDEFMSTLDHTGPQLTSVLKGDWMGLYRWVTQVSA